MDPAKSPATTSSGISICSSSSRRTSQKHRHNHHRQDLDAALIRQNRRDLLDDIRSRQFSARITSSKNTVRPPTPPKSRRMASTRQLHLGNHVSNGCVSGTAATTTLSEHVSGRSARRSRRDVFGRNADELSAFDDSFTDNLFAWRHPVAVELSTSLASAKSVGASSTDSFTDLVLWKRNL